MSADRLLTADELAERWQVTKAWVYHAARTGQIPTVKLGRYYRFRASSIEAFEQRVEVGTGC
jgi:excisionase family DNA binding protein